MTLFGSRYRRKEEGLGISVTSPRAQSLRSHRRSLIRQANGAPGQAVPAVGAGADAV